MNKKNIAALSLASGFLVNNSNAQSYQKNDSGIRTTTDCLNIEIQFYRPSIIRIVKSPLYRNISKENLPVLKVPQKNAFTVSNTTTYST